MEHYEIPNSSNVKSVSYMDGVLQVEFKNTKIYLYYNVPEHLFRLLLSAPSKGKFLHKNIIGIYPEEKIR